jgi:hypothetical protein
LAIEDVIGKYKSSREGGGLVVVTHDKAKDLVTIVNTGKPTWEKGKSQFLPENGADGLRYEGPYGRGTLTVVDGVKQIQWSQRMDGVRWTSLTEAGAAQLAKEESDRKQLEDKIRLAAGLTGDTPIGELMGMCRDQFDKLNTDKKDEVLDAAEIQMFFQEKFSFTPEECKTTLAKWDADKSGSIDFEEFCMMTAGLFKAAKEDTEFLAEQIRKLEADESFVLKEAKCTACLGICGICFSPCTLGLSMLPAWLLAQKGQSDLVQLRKQKLATAREINERNVTTAKKTLLAGPVKTK